MVKKFIAFAVSVCMVFSFVFFGASATEDKKLRFGNDGKFTILQITDTQDDHCLADGLVDFIEKSIEATNPDLIVITGDLVEDSRAGDISDSEIFKEGVTVDGDYEATLENTKKAVEQIFAPLEKSGIPYAVAQGNNDYKSGITNEDWLEIYADYPGCIAYDMSDDAEGKIDFYLPILSSSSDEAAFGIWMLDNGRDFSQSQLEWFSSYNTNGVPSVVFEHIPVDDMGNLYEECSIFDEGAILSGGKAYRLKGDIAHGHAEGIIEPGASTPEFAAWKNQNVVGAFFGHWHTSGFTGVWDSITLGMTYGCQFSKSGPYGVRTVTLDEASGTIETELYEYIDGEFIIQADEPYKQHNSTFEEIFAGLMNFFKNIFNAILYLLKF